MNITQKVILLILVVLLADQGLKIWVKTHMMLEDKIQIFGNWFLLHFTENPGMAFGMELGGRMGKLALSLFRIVAVIAMGFWIRSLIKMQVSGFFILCVGLILAGALGNILDSIFYGVIFGSSEHQLATFFPPGGGYESFFHGRVVDMFYAPMFRGNWPEWMPFGYSGRRFTFFRFIFNVADASISIGVFLIIIFYRRFFPDEEKMNPESLEEAALEVGLTKP